ncbi:hypothetical protein LXA43DRAFT_972467 [Ganoderma leucocontextum]|nr:hypothetical protein LXA43DRAFT_972467 [Ganoderma leucocontextum]
MALESIVTHTGPGTTFTLPLASPPLTQSPSSTPSSTLNSPLPITTIQLRRSSYGGVAYYGAHSHFPGDSPDRSHKELSERHSELAESLKRSVTIVFWHKANMQPFRLRREISTFPLLRLSEVEPIMAAFRLLANSYIEVYNPDARAWEKEQVCAVRSVESQQRVLFRVCHSIIHSLEDSECPGLDAEIRLQEESRCTSAVPLIYHPVDTTSPRKRSADELLTQPPSKYHRSCSAQSSISPHMAVNGFESSPSEDLIEPPSAQPACVSPISSPSVSVTPPLPATTTSTTNLQPRQESHYTPHTPISPVHYPSSRIAPMVAISPRTSGSILSLPLPRPTISSESSLAMAVTPPTHTLSLQRSPASESPTHAPQSGLPLPSPQAHGNANPTPSPTPASTPLPSTSSLFAPNDDREPTPATTQGSGAAKAWPHGKYVYEIDAGFTAMEAAMAREPALKQPDAFRRAFGVPHKKSTVCSHKKVWKSAPQDMLAEWRARGREDGGLWSEFVRAVEGKDLKRGAPTAAAFGSPQGGVLHLNAGTRSGPGTGLGMRIQSAQGLGVRLEEPMASLRPPMVRPYFGDRF